MKRSYKIPVTWEVGADLYIDADSLEEAIELAEEAELPTDCEYLDGSYTVYEEMISMLNEEGDYEEI